MSFYLFYDIIYIGDYMIIENNVTNILEIKKSKFITLLIKIDDSNDVDKYLDNIKKEYKDATHYCYAYVIGNKEKANDDGEPSGTAGIPILNVLKRNSLNNILCVVIRYFGGIKLGAGGLLRAYSNSVSEALKVSNIIEYVPTLKIKIVFKYDNLNTINNLLINSNIIYKEFDVNITYEVIITETEYTNIIDNLNSNCIEINTI